MFRGYQDLKVWQAAMDLAEAVYSASVAFPRTEVYGLTAQIQRAAVSVVSNIAEGHARDSTKEFLRFLSVSMGSLAELETQLMLAQRFHYLGSPQLETLLIRTNELGRMLRGLQHSLKSRL